MTCTGCSYATTSSKVQLKPDNTSIHAAVLHWQVCKSGMTNARKIWLTRHGESVYNQQALIGGDSPLSPNGQAYSELLPEVILSRLPQVRYKDSIMQPRQVLQSSSSSSRVNCHVTCALGLPLASLMHGVTSGCARTHTVLQLCFDHPCRGAKLGYG